jgi:hypothetical protein
MKDLVHKIMEQVYNAQYQCGKLYEFATPIGKIHAKVKSLAEPIIMHILKVLYYGESNSELKEHWTIEIETFLQQTISSTIKGTNKHPSAEQLYSWLTDEPMETIKDFEGLLRVVLAKGRSYQGQEKALSSEDAYERTQEFLHKVTKDLADLNLTHSRLEEYVQNILLR